jgi:hypothetical protein
MPWIQKKIAIGAGSVVVIIVSLLLFINLYLDQTGIASLVAGINEPTEEAPAAEEQEPTEAAAPDTGTVIAETTTSSPTSPTPTATHAPVSSSQPLAQRN